MIEKLKNLRKEYGKFGGMAGLVMVLPAFGSATLLLSIYEIAPWLQEKQQLGFFVFVLVMSVLSGFALIATNVLGIVSGFAFDFQFGILAQVLGIVGASTIMFYVAKRYARENLNGIIESKPKFRAIHSALLNERFLRTLLIITLIRLSPAMPFAVTNFTLSAAGVSLKTFLAGTIIGMLPRSSAVVFVGSSLTELNFSQPQESWIIVVGIVATIIATIVVGSFSKKALDQITIQSETGVA
jgi:uncharacterized membrane protein YdjX (TVP38/TMEM64 family)